MTSLSLSCTGEGNGSPLLCSCLENPRDRGAWWAAIYGVAQSRTRLKRLSSSSSRGPMCGFPGGSAVKNTPAVWETWIRFLSWEDPLQEGMATRSSILPGESHGQMGLANDSPLGCKESDTTETTQHMHHRLKSEIFVTLQEPVLAH